MIIVVPAYEPDQRMITLLKDIQNKFTCTVIVVDDGSGKEYDTIFETAKKYAKVVRLQQNRGKGSALKRAYRDILMNGLGKRDIIVTVDADGQHKVEDIEKLLHHYNQKKANLFMGVRTFDKEVPFKSKWGNRITKIIFRLVSGKSISDTQTGLRGMPYEELTDMIAIPGERYEYEMNVLLEYAKRGKEIVEIPIETVYMDNNSSSHFHPVKDSLSIYKEILKYCLSSFLGFVIDFCGYGVLLFLLTGLPSGLAVVLSNVTARAISSVANFEMNKNWVFASKERTKEKAIKYFSLVLVILSINSGLLYVATQVFGIPNIIGKVMVEIILFFLSYWIQHHFIFLNPESKRTNQREVLE